MCALNPKHFPATGQDLRLRVQRLWHDFLRKHFLSRSFLFFSLRGPLTHNGSELCESKKETLVEKNLLWKRLLSDSASLAVLMPKIMLCAQAGAEGGELGLLHGASVLPFLHCWCSSFSIRTTLSISASETHFTSQPATFRA